jgi:hypothetical protein
MKIVIGVIALFVFVGLGIFLFAPSSHGQKQFSEEPTVVTKGQRTDEERAYSNEYKKLYSAIATQKLTDLKKSDRKAGVELGVSIGKEKPFFLGIETPPTSQEFLHRLVCGADAVVLGTPITKISHLTEDETFVYSQYSFRVEKVFKETPPIKGGEIISVTRPGGLVKVNSQVIRVEDKNFEQLQFGKEYVLFLRYVPAASGYMIADPDGDVVLDGAVINGLSNMEIPDYIGRDVPVTTYFQDLSLAATRECNKQ